MSDEVPPTDRATGLSDHVERVIAKLSDRAHNTPRDARTDLVPYVPPGNLAPELGAQVERIITKPRNLVPGIDRDDPGLLLAPIPKTFHPDAQAAADARRAALERPADPGAIRQWAVSFAAGLGNAPTDDAFTGWLSALLVVCGDDVPGAVWSIDTLRIALRTFKKFWPNPGELFEVLEARANHLWREVGALEEIAHTGQYRGPRGKSTEVYEPVAFTHPSQMASASVISVAAALLRKSHDKPIEADEAEHHDDEATRSAKQQLTLLGMTSEEAATALTANNARRYSSKPETPENGGSPANPKTGLRVVK